MTQSKVVSRKTGYILHLRREEKHQGRMTQKKIVCNNYKYFTGGRFEKTSEGVFRVSITPPRDTVPSVQVFVDEYGIKEPDAIASQMVEATKDKGKDELAKEIGLEVIKNSRVLKVWFKKNKK